MNCPSCRHESTPPIQAVPWSSERSLVFRQCTACGFVWGRLAPSENSEPLDFTSASASREADADAYEAEHERRNDGRSSCDPIY